MSNPFVIPPALEPGDKVAIVSPASGLASAFPHVYERGLERLQSVYDLTPVEFPTAKRTDDYLYEHPEERARDIENAFADPNIQGVIATIGGNDQIRILKYLDSDILIENPTRFYGSSDNTSLVHFLWNQGIVSYYGGMLLTDFATPGQLPEYLETSLRSALFDDVIGAISPASEFTDQDLDWSNPDNLTRQPEMEANPGWIWRGGHTSVEGQTWGGGFETTYQHVIADRYLPELTALDGGVLLLETSEELPSTAVVQRVLHGFGERGLLSCFDGFLIGRTKARSHTLNRSTEERDQYRQQIRQTISKIITEYNPTAPIVFNVDFGHTTPAVPVPIGATVTIDPQNERIVFN